MLQNLGRRPRTDAGLLALNDEIKRTSTVKLIEMIGALIEAPADLQPLCWSRLRLSVYEVERRIREGEAGA